MFTNIDTLPLGKLLQPKQQKGTTVRKIRKKMPGNKKKSC